MDSGGVYDFCRSRRNAAEDRLPNILQLNTKGLTADNISVIEQLANKNKAFIVVLQETHCTTADKLVIPNFSLTGSILSRNHGLATFVHERLEWSLVDQSPEQSETEWLCVDVAGYKIVNVYKPPRSWLTLTTIPTSPHPSLYVGDFNCQHVNWGYNTTSHQDSRFLPTAIRWSVGTFARPIGSAFAFSQVNPSRDCHLRTHQILRGHSRISARAYFLQLNNVSHVAAWRTMCHVGTKSARPSIAPLSVPQWGLPLTEPPRLYFLDYNRRSRSDGRKLSTPLTFRTPATRRGEQSTKLLAGVDAPSPCTPSRQTPSPCNWWRTGHTRLATVSPPGSSINSCPTYGRFQHLRVTVYPNLSDRKSLLLPSETWSQANLRDWTPSLRSLYSMPSRLSNLGSATSSIPACANSKFQRSGEEH